MSMNGILREVSPGGSGGSLSAVAHGDGAFCP